MSSRSWMIPTLASAATIAASLILLAAAQPPQSQPLPIKPASTQGAQPGDKPKPLNLATRVEEVLAQRIAKQLIAASPVAAPSDIKARDAAAAKLAACDDLINAISGGAEGRILWGGFHPEQGYDPENYRLSDLARHDHFQLTELNPLVWAKLYLSTFMFPGPFEVRKEGRFTVLELDTKFRSDLDPGEYPYPFWHSPNKWTAYVRVQKLVFIFERTGLIAALRRSPDPLSIEQIRRPWDTKWLWTDKDGNPQPRVALFTYLFSKDNPHVPALDKSFRALESGFREQNCMLCHEPDNRSRINDLLLLNYPNQALIMRRNLVAILETNQMPPGSALAGEPQGIQDKKLLAELVKLAKDFQRQADDAFAYEKANPSKPPTPAAPTSLPASKPQNP